MKSANITSAAVTGYSVGFIPVPAVAIYFLDAALAAAFVSRE
jgi:hypothetical protein